MGAEVASQGRVALFYPHGAFPTVAGLLDATRILADRGYKVEVYYRGTPEYMTDRLTYPGVSVTDDKPGVFSLGPARYPRLMRRGTGVYSRIVKGGPHRWWRCPRCHSRDIPGGAARRSGWEWPVARQ